MDISSAEAHLSGQYANAGISSNECNREHSPVLYYSAGLGQHKMRERASS